MSIADTLRAIATFSTAFITIQSQLSFTSIIKMTVIAAGDLTELRITLGFQHVNPIISEGIFDLSIIVVLKIQF